MADSSRVLSTFDLFYAMFFFLAFSSSFFTFTTIFKAWPFTIPISSSSACLTSWYAAKYIWGCRNCLFRFPPSCPSTNPSQFSPKTQSNRHWPDPSSPPFRSSSSQKSSPSNMPFSVPTSPHTYNFRRMLLQKRRLLVIIIGTVFPLNQIFQFLLPTTPVHHYLNYIIKTNHNHQNTTIINSNFSQFGLQLVLSNSVVSQSRNNPSWCQMPYLYKFLSGVKTCVLQQDVPTARMTVSKISQIVDCIK